MESFRTFMSIFETCVRDQDSDGLATILMDGKTYFQNLTTNDSELVLSTLFDVNKGLPSFLYTELCRREARRNFDNAIVKAFSLITFIIEELHAIFHQYISPVKEICQLALLMHCSMYIKKAACNTLNKLIEIFKEEDLRLGETVIECMTNLYKFQKKEHIKERSLILSVCGTIAKYHPQVPELQSKKKLILKQLLNDFSLQYDPLAINEDSGIQIYLEVLTNILGDLFTPEEIEKKHFEVIYKWIKALSNPKETQRKNIKRTAITLLYKCISRFGEFVYHDYIFWHNLLTVLAREQWENGKCGQRALKAYYNNLKYMLEHNDSEEDKKIFSYFKNLLSTQLMDPTTDSHSLHLVVYGFSKLARPCKKFLTVEDVKDMYLLISRSIAPLWLREDIKQEHLNNICDYQEAMSEILCYVSDISIAHINLLIKTSVLLIKKYPSFSTEYQYSAIYTLIKTITDIASTNKILLEEFLYDLIHDGIIWSCSHTLYIDAELQRGLSNSLERPICYKNYLPLWLELIKLERYKYQRRMLIAQSVFDKMVEVFITLIKKLNLNTKIKEECELSDIAFSQKAENGTDFKIFINLTDLMIDIINEMESDLLQNTIYKLLYEIIKMSYKYPLISAFYKLVRVIIKTSEIFCDLEKEDHLEIRELVYKYLMNTLDQISSFSNELLTACLYLIMYAPIIYVQDILNRTLPVFKVVFAMGLNDFELALTGLSTLEKWTSYLNGAYTKEFLLEVVPMLELFLQSKESYVDILQDIIQSRQKNVKHITLIDSKKSLENLQNRILLFLGTLDYDILSNLVHQKALNTGATWDKKDLLQCTLQFPDVKTEIYFDKILPRIMMLAQSSGDRRTKVNACELLHAIVLFILGKSAQYNVTKPDRFLNCYETLYPALLNLGCDSDEVVWKLFHPLTVRLSHWLSSQFMYKSTVTLCFINALFNGLCNDSNSALKEFSGMCLAEFIEWSIRQASPVEKINVNVHEVIRRIFNFAVYPSARKRIAAAVAFNHLYKILREYEEIISIYWLELLYCFVKSLDGCNDVSIYNSLNHINRVIREKIHLLSDDDSDRRKPFEFEGRTINHAVIWLFSQCGSLNKNCRHECMELFIKISEYIANMNSTDNILESHIEKTGIKAFNQVILKDLQLKWNRISTTNVLLLLRSLDCYIWLITEKLIDMNYLFTNVNPDKDIIFHCIRNFVNLLSNVKMQTEDETTIIATEVEELQALQCKTIIKIFNFIQILWNFHNNVIPEYLLNEQFFDLIAKCIMCPQAIGYDMKNTMVNEQFPSMLEQLLNLLTQKISDLQLNYLKNKLRYYVLMHSDEFFLLGKNRKEIPVNLRQYIRGLIILEHCNILNDICKDQMGFQEPQQNIIRIFHSLSKEEMGRPICVRFSELTIEYLQNVMELFLASCKQSMRKTLIDLIRNETMLLGLDSIEISHGLYFLNTFKNSILLYILKDVEEAIVILKNLLQENPSFLLTMLEELLVFTKRNKNKWKDIVERFAETIVTQFVEMKKMVNHTESRKQKLINIFGISVHLMHKPTRVSQLSQEFYQWILDEFLEKNADIEYKTQLLQHFLICLTDETSTYKPELAVILRNLRNDRLAICTKIQNEHNVETLKLKNCFHTLLTLLPATKSLIVFETTIYFAAGAINYLFHEEINEYLEKYFASFCYISDKNFTALRSIEIVYRIFMDPNSLGNEISNRFDVLERFLLPTFQFCNTDVIENFYEQNIKDVLMMITREFIGSNIDIQQLIVSKIGSYELTTIMFVKVDLDKIKSFNCKIIENSVENIKTGEEILAEIYRNILNMKSIKIHNPDYKEIMRKLHCSAYNCLIAMASLKEKEELYDSVFNECRAKNQLIWENIIDGNKVYITGQAMAEYPKQRKKLINIKNKLKQERHMEHMNYSYIHTYEVATSTLTEDLNAYDLNKAHIVPKRTTNENMTLLFECDDLNNHECMPSICGFLIQIMADKISIASQNESNITLPYYLNLFRLSMLDKYQNNNVRLFMLKFILNTQEVFKAYARHFLLPLIYITNSYLETQCLNYVITDILMMLIDWHTIAIPTTEKEKKFTQKLFERIICRILTTETNEVATTIYKYNVNIVKTVVEVWNMCLEIPRNMDQLIERKPDFAVNLILAYLLNNLHTSIISQDNILQFLQNTATNWQGNEEIVLRSCEALGAILKHVANNTDLANKKFDIIAILKNIFREMQMKFTSRQAKCMWSVCKHYPDVVMEFTECITIGMMKADPARKAIYLELFLLAIPKLKKQQIITEISYMKFQDLLKSRIAPCEKVGLKIIHALIPQLDPPDLLTFVKLILPYVKIDFTEYREIAYNIFMCIYTKYMRSVTDDENVRELVCTSKQILLAGLLDPAIELQEKVLRFWTEDVNLSNESMHRLIEILNMYSSNVENVFLSFIPLTILHLLTKTNEYTKKMFEPLYECNWKNYEIVTSWKTKNLGSMAPLFAPSLASQINEVFTQSISSSYNPNNQSSYVPFASTSTNFLPRVLATKEPEFEPTFANEEPKIPSNMNEDSKIVVASIPQPAYNKRSRRFLTHSSNVTAFIRRKQIVKNILREEMIKEEAVRQRSSVQLSRKYRIGDFPDVEITLFDLVKPLQELCKKDQLICKDTTVIILCSFLESISQETNDFFNNVATILKDILNNCQGNSPIVATVLDIMFSSGITDCSPNVVAKISKASNLNFLGTLLLEESIICQKDVSSPVLKRIRIENLSNQQSDKWIRLANLYESLNELDVVLSIFKHKASNADIQIASVARATSEWTRGKIAYENAYKTESESVKEHCLQGLFECLSYLSSWTEIEEHINNRLNNNIDNIWNDPWKDWLFPWVFKVYIYKLLAFNESTEFKESIQLINSWLEENEEKANYIERKFGEELAMFSASCNSTDAQKFLTFALDELREQWIKLRPLCAQLKMQMLHKLRGISDVNMFLMCMKNTDVSQGTQNLIRFWSNTVPSIQDDLRTWDKLVRSRTVLALDPIKHIEKLLEDETQNDEGYEIIQNLRAVCCKVSLIVIDMALKQNNTFIAREHLSYLKNQLHHCSFQMKLQYGLSKAKIKYLIGNDQSLVEKKMAAYTSSWQYLHKILQENDIDISNTARQYISSLANTIIDCSHKNAQFAELLIKNDVILKELQGYCRTEESSLERSRVEYNALDKINSSLEYYSLNKLKECCQMKTIKIKDCYFTLLKYCYEKLCNDNGTIRHSDYSKDFIHSTLRAMQHGSLEATHYFPYLLKDEYLNDEEAKRIFIEESSEIQTWLFLTWQSQLFSHLGTSIAPLILPILKRIVEDYPNAVVYTFHLVTQINRALLNNSEICQMKQFFDKNIEIQQFFKAMEYVVQPELYLEYHLHEFIRNLTANLGIITATDLLLKRVYSPMEDSQNEPKPGYIYNIIKSYKRTIERYREGNLSHVKIIEDVKRICAKLQESLKKRPDKVLLKDYSPWLYRLTASNLEVPGQYTGKRKPMPQYHAKIMKIEPVVKVMRSLRKPIRITIVGNDTKDYNFLVKFGEDLRLDQRVQQAFSIVNETLSTDVACRQRSLSLNTYQVLPLSKYLGLIQWIEDTRSLQELISFTLSDEQLSKYDQIYMDYKTWIKKAAPSKNIIEQYKEATLKYTASIVVTKMNELIGKTQWDSLRKTCITLSPSPESFVALRKNFVLSYATMCAVDWILGVGDRHLENILVIIGSGKCLGIDFNLTFGAGMDSKIPELMPFRLTTQILGLLKPYTERDLFGATMVHVLNALQNDMGPLLACLDVFVREPLNWEEHINKVEKEIGEDNIYIKWLSEKKINMVLKKLNGMNPCAVTLEQLKDQHDQCFTRYTAIVSGTDEIKRARASLENKYLTTEQQVECLLDQATDLNILGRTQVGWRPWL